MIALSQTSQNEASLSCSQETDSVVCVSVYVQTCMGLLERMSFHMMDGHVPMAGHFEH